MRTYYELDLEKFPNPRDFIGFLIDALSSEITFAHVELWWPPNEQSLRAEIEKIDAEMGEIVGANRRTTGRGRRTKVEWIELEFDFASRPVESRLALLSALIPIAANARLGSSDVVGTELISVVQDGKSQNLGVWLTKQEGVEVRRQFPEFDHFVI